MSDGNLVTQAEARAFIGISESAMASTILDALIPAAEGYVAMYCGCALVEDEVTEDVEGGGIYLRPTRLPIASVDTITDLTNDDSEFSDYIVSKTAIARDETMRTRWEKGFARWRVTYTGGYGDTYAAPGALKVAVLMIIARLYNNRQGLRSQSAGAGDSFGYADVMTSDICVLLDPFVMGR